MLETLSAAPYDRRNQRILIIGSGFGMELNPAQFRTVQEAGFRLHVVTGLPNPENTGVPVVQYIPSIKKAIDEFQPHAVACASKGGPFMVALWQTGTWLGPSLVINLHPCITALPKGVPIVLCHGSNDEYYSYPREHIEALMRTGTANRRLLYFTGNSGPLGRGYTREGDKHNMASILQYDCLPRLFDSVMYPGDPEVCLMSTWDTMIEETRRDAEAQLGFRPEDLKRHWQSTECMGQDEQVLFRVAPGTPEFDQVAACFLAQPKVPRAYLDMNPGLWKTVSILAIERVENGLQEDGNATPYCRALQRGIEAQGLEFRPGLHTKWAFHGSSAVEEIVSNPISGFQPLMSGSRAAALWGPGTYFARDAKYVYDGGFCKLFPDGTKQMLLCLLMTGIPCLGDPAHRGVLPVRHGRHRYNSSVDSLSNPEIYVTQNPGAGYPAYVITFR